MGVGVIPGNLFGLVIYKEHFHATNLVSRGVFPLADVAWVAVPLRICEFQPGWRFEHGQKYKHSGYTNTVAWTVESFTFFLSIIRQVPQMKTAVVKDSRKTDRAILNKKRAGIALALFAGIAMPFAGCDSGSKPPAKVPSSADGAPGGFEDKQAAPVVSASAGAVIPGVGYSMPAKVGKYEVLNIMTDNKDDAIAKSNAESALVSNPDVNCMVGLWAYNPPAILSALEARSLAGKVKIVGFDEHPATLAGIADGKIIGTIAQQPYLFGFKSVEYLAAMARNQEVKVPESKMIYVPHSVVTADNIQEFNAGVQAIRDGNGPIPKSDSESYDTSKGTKLAFITNSVDLFWVLAQKGCEKADGVFNTKTAVTFPSQGTVDEQKQALEQAVNNGFDGLAISPINPENQVDMLNMAAEKMAVVCQDSDAPKSNRKFYLGTSNYLAGRAAGKLVKQAIPEGGKVMIFVGKLEVLNAQERSRGVIDELADKPLPPGFETAAN